MKHFEVRYLNNEGNVATTRIAVEDDQDESDATWKAIAEDYGHGDGINQILGVQQVYDEEDSPSSLDNPGNCNIPDGDPAP
mgnify:CR=1 FL=1